MCGVAGAVSFRLPLSAIRNGVRAMAAAIIHRGPDGAGLWSDPDVGLAFAHQRLAILDLSAAGHQPMVSASGRYVITFNGEIYNHRTLRDDLERSGSLLRAWAGHSDTETLLVAIETWGLSGALQRSVGMFALALWDRNCRTLSLARDRFGEKPLYVGLSGSEGNLALLFGSELGAIRAWPGFEPSIDRQAITQLLRFTVIPAPRSIYSGIQQLLPGHLMHIELANGVPTVLPASSAWWSFRSSLADALSKPCLHHEEGLNRLEEALQLAVAEQAVADVPLGAFLSGGIDSSLITALLQATSSHQVRTFTIGFEEAAFNEAPYARAVAAYLGTDHSEMLLTAADAQTLIPRLPQLYSEPFADSSQLPTHLVCREARRSGLTVALSGDGGDELFGGYNRYFWGPRIWSRFAWLPWPLRRTLGMAIRCLPPTGWDSLGRPLPIHQIGQKAHKLADRLRYVRNIDDLYRSLVSEWHDPSALLQTAGAESLIHEPSSPLDWPLPSCLSSDAVARMMAIDTLNYLPNDILTKLDRAAMAVSLETRAPFLDHRVAQVAWQLPMAMRIHPGRSGGTSKWALRQILYKYVPPALIERTKAGFAIPIGQWLREPLRAWAEDLLDPCLMQRQGYLQPEPIQRIWQQHLSGRFDHTTRLWTVLMWQAWLES